MAATNIIYSTPAPARRWTLALRCRIL